MGWSVIYIICISMGMNLIVIVYFSGRDIDIKRRANQTYEVPHLKLGRRNGVIIKDPLDLNEIDTVETRNRRITVGLSRLPDVVQGNEDN